MRTTDLRELTSYLLNDLGYGEEWFTLRQHVTTTEGRNMISEIMGLCQRKGVKRAVWISTSSRALELTRRSTSGDDPSEVPKAAENETLLVAACCTAAMYFYLRAEGRDRDDAREQVRQALEHAMAATMAYFDARQSQNGDEHRTETRLTFELKVRRVLIDVLVDVFF